MAHSAIFMSDVCFDTIQLQEIKTELPLHECEHIKEKPNVSGVFS